MGLIFGRVYYFGGGWGALIIGILQYYTVSLLYYTEITGVKRQQMGHSSSEIKAE